MDNINRITLEYLTNKEHKFKILNPNQISNNLTINNLNDKKFYRRRILDLTKGMLLNNYPDELLSDVKYSFNLYIKTCISYFKIKDETDIIQEDYEINTSNFDEIELIEEINNICLDSNISDTPEEANKLMMKSINHNKLSLNQFIKKTKNVENITFSPQLKEINLKDPILKHKGIIKKNNINKSYKENETQNEETQKKI